MQRIVLNMQSYIMGDAIKTVFETGGDFHVTVIDSTDDVTEKCCSLVANTIIMEVTGYPPWLLEERLKIRDEIKKRIPDCKVVLLVDENAEREVAEQVKQAKSDGLIDLFLYGSTSASFLTALVGTL